MKMKKFWKKAIARVLTAVMLVSVFSTVDMGWNVIEVKAETTYDIVFENGPNNSTNDYKSGSYSYTCVLTGSMKAKNNAKAGDILKFWSIRPDTDDNSKYTAVILYVKDGSNTTKLKVAYGSDDPTTYTIPSGKVIEKFENSSPQSNDPGTNVWTIVLQTHPHSFTEKSTTDTYLKSKATCTAAAVYYYKCSGCSEKGTDTYSSGSELGHSYGTPSYTWLPDGKSCTAKRTCTRVTSHTDTQDATITSDVKTPATCTAKGTTTYTAKFTNTAFLQQTKDVQDINALGHNFKYTGSGNVITATCSRDESHTANLTLNASDSTYDGTAKLATVGNWSNSYDSLAAEPTTITYTNQEGTETYNSTTAPTNVGDYTASITVDTATATKDFSITKKDVAVSDLTVSYENSVYDGQAKPATVSLANGKTGLGVVTFKYQKQNGSDWETATTEAPVNAGTYRILVSTAEGDNFSATSSDLTDDDWKFTIAKKQITINPNEGQSKKFGAEDPTYSYTHNALIGSDTITGEMGREPGEDVKSEGYAFTLGTLGAGINYILSIAAEAPKFIINRLDSMTPPAPGEGYILDYEKEELKAEPDTIFEIGKIGEDGEYITISGPEELEPGDTEQTYYVRYKENDNYPSSDWVPITIAPRPSAPEESDVVERTDKSFTLQMIPGVEYSIDGTNWFTASDTDRNVTVSDGKITFGGLTPDRDYTVHSRVKATDNAPRSEETTQTVRTKKALPENLKDAFDYTPPTGDLIYDKEAKEASVTPKEGYQGVGEPVIKYYDKDVNEVKNPTDAGEYKVKVSAPATDDYLAVPETEVGTFTIAKKEITITPTSAQSKVYGTPDPVLTYDATPALYTGDTFTGALSYGSAGVYTNVGNYSIVMGNLSAGNNYTLTLESETFEIKRAEYTSGPAKNIGYTVDYVDETMVVTSAADFELSSTDTETATPLVDDKVEPGKTYYIRYKESTNQSESPWSAITLPNRPAAPNATGKQETVMNKKDAEISGVNSTMEYKFDGDGDWTGVTGSIISNPDNKNTAIRVKASNDNKNFYGQEKSITFTASTTKLKVRIGDKVLEVPYGATIPVTEKPQDPTPPAGQVFMYWAFGDKKWDFDGEDGVTVPSEVTGNITLVPVWGVEIHGTITAQDYDSITEVSLVDGKGNSFNHHDLDKQEDGTYKYSVIAPVGVDYNLVVEGKKIISKTPHNITKTQLVNLKQGGNGDIVMPAGVFNSKVIKDKARNYEHTLVGGLDEIADAHEETSDIVTVEMKVSADVSNDSKIKSAIKNKTLDFVELTLTKTTNGKEENIGSTNKQLLEIIIPYNTVGKYNISVYRYHGDEVETLIPAKNIDGEYIKVGADTVTIYAKKFSTYAIGYSTTPPSSDPSNSNKPQGDDSDDSGSAPSGTPLPKKDTPTEKKPSDGLPKLIAKNTPKKDGKKEITDTNLLVSNTTGDGKDNLEKNENVKGDPVVENDETQLGVGTSVPETEANKGSHRHHLLWLYLVLLALFFVARAITKEKANAVKISLLAGDVVIAGLLLFVVKICVLSVIVCLAEIAIALAIHLKMKG